MNKRRRKKAIDKCAHEMARITLEAWRKDGVPPEEQRRRLIAAYEIVTRIREPRAS